MTSVELIEHQIECLKMAQYYQFLQLFDPKNDDLKQGIELLLKFADRAKYRAMCEERDECKRWRKKG